MGRGLVGSVAAVLCGGGTPMDDSVPSRGDFIDTIAPDPTTTFPFNDMVVVVDATVPVVLVEGGNIEGGGSDIDSVGVYGSR